MKLISNDKRGSFIILVVLSLIFIMGSVSGNFTSNESNNTNSSLNVTLNVTVVNESNETIEEVQEIAETQDPQKEIIVPEIEDQQIITPEIKEVILPDVRDNIEKYNEKLNRKTEDFFEISEDDEKRSYIVKFEKKIKELDSLATVKEYGRFKLSKVEGKTKDILKVLEDENVKYVELDQDILITGDTITWNVNRTNAPNVWNSTNGSGIKVAILDTGIASHSDLSIAGGNSTVSDNYSDTHGHGTAVAGVIGALKNDLGLIGVSYGADIYAVKVMNSSVGSLSDAISGVEWSVDNGMDIVSMSFGMDSYSQIFKETLEDAFDEGLLLVASSGNTGDEGVLYPGAYDVVIAVGAVNQNDGVPSFSSKGYELELVAPGVDVNTTNLSGNYSLFSGTSFAAPHVSGVAALIWSNNTSLTNVELRAKLRNDALDLGVSGKDDEFGYGLVQASLDEWNFNYSNFSYFYDVFNVSDYGESNVSYTFWLNGTGTIDDVNFSDEGYYFVNKTINGAITNMTLYVDENGSVSVAAPLTHWDDSFDYHGADNDGIVWEDGTLDFKYEELGPQADVICYDDDFDSPDFDFWKCWAQSPAFLTDCRNAHPELDSACAGSTPCDTSDFYGWHSIPSSNLNSPDDINLRLLAFYDCDGLPYNQTPGFIYYIIDQKRTFCDGSVDYDIEGDYGHSSEWTEIEEISCGTGSECDISQDEVSCSTETCDLQSPCRRKESFSCNETDSSVTNDCSSGLNCCNGICTAGICENACDGTFFVNAVGPDESGVVGETVNVWLNGEFNTTNNSVEGISQAEIDFVGVECGLKQNVTVYCEDNSTVCGTKKSSIDFNGDTDSLFFECAVCDDEDKRLYADINDVFIEFDHSTVVPLESFYNVTVTVHSLNIEDPAVNISFKGQAGTGLIVDEGYDIISISDDSSVDASVILRTYSEEYGLGIENSVEFIHIYIDPDSETDDDKKEDNYILVPFRVNKLKLNLSINTSYPEVDEAIRTYLSFFIDDVSLEDADYQLSIGKFTQEVDLYNSETLNKNGRKWGLKDNDKHAGILIDTVLLTKPYTGIIGTHESLSASKPTVFVYGNRIEGTIASLKTYLSALEKYSPTLIKRVYNQPPLLRPFEENKLITIQDEFDVFSISIFDLFHNKENQIFFNSTNSEDFSEVVLNILNENNFETSIKTVKTINDNTTLRIKHANSLFSDDFKDVIVTNNQPVVLAQGLHSDLHSWDGLGEELVGSGMDVWQIELYGGPSTDSSCKPSGLYDCPNYTFFDLTEYYWPALLAGVQQYSGQNDLSYVGFDLGCTVALESLENHSNGTNSTGYYFDTTTGQYTLTDLSNSPIDTFIGLGCIDKFIPVETSSGEGLHIAKFPSVLNKTYEEIDHRLGAHINALDFKIKLLLYEFPEVVFSDLKSLFKNPTSITKEIIKLTFFNIFSEDLPFVGKKVSKNIYAEIVDRLKNPASYDVGENVELDKFMVIESDKGFVIGGFGLIPDNSGTDGFVSIEDQKEICQNVNSSNKTYIEMFGLNHFEGSLVFGDSLINDKNVHNIIVDYLDNYELEPQNLQYIKSTEGDCN